MHSQYIIAFISYFIVLFAIGLASHKVQKSSKEFIMGNRSLSYWVTAFSAHASDMSAWLFMAFPAALFIGGLSQVWIGFGLLIGMYLNWQFVAQKLRIDTEKYESYTLSSYFENKFGDRSGILRILTASMTIIFMTFYLGAALMAMGYLIESLFSINYFLGLSIALFVAMTYTFVGGYSTVAKVDQFQAIFLLVMIVIVPLTGFFSLPSGFEDILRIARKENISFSLFADHSIGGYVGILFLLLSWGLGYFGQPHIITKFMGIKSPVELRKSKYVGMAWQITALTAAASVGFVGIGFFQGNLSNPELVFVEMVKHLFNPMVAGFILCGVLAANISTMDSQILVCASVLSEDFYKHIFKTHASEKELLIVSRAGVVVISFLALIIAFTQSSSVLDAVLYAWSGLGCSFGPLILMSLYFKKCNKYGAIAGILIGGIIAGIWPTINPFITDFAIPSMIPGFALSILSIYLVSKLSLQSQSKY